MNDSTLFVGLDSHKDSNVAAYSVGLGEVQSLGNIGVRERDLDRLCTRMLSKDHCRSSEYVRRGVVERRCRTRTAGSTDRVHRPIASWPPSASSTRSNCGGAKRCRRAGAQVHGADSISSWRGVLAKNTCIGNATFLRLTGRIRPAMRQVETIMALEAERGGSLFLLTGVRS